MRLAETELNARKIQADRVKTHARNDFAGYFSAAAGIPMPNSMNVRCLSEFHLDIPRAGEIYALEIFWDRVFTQSARDSDSSKDMIAMLPD